MENLDLSSFRPTSVRCLAAALLHNPDAYQTIKGIVSSENITDAKCKQIFAAFEKAENNENVSLQAVADMLDDGVYADVVTWDAMLPLAPTQERIIEWALAAKDECEKSKLIDAVNSVYLDLLGQNSTAIDAIGRLQKIVSDATAGTPSAALDMQALSSKFLDEMNKPSKHISTGFSAIDTCTGGFARGDFNIIAGRPGSGKTALAANIAVNMATNEARVLYESLEISDTDIFARCVSDAGSIEAWRLRDRVFNDEYRQKIQQTAQSLSELPIFVNSSCRGTLPEIESDICKVHPDVCIIDNIDLIVPNQNRNQRYIEIEETVHFLKRMTRRTDCSVIGLVQLTRSVDALNPGAAPRLGDLAGGSTLEHDSSTILALSPLKDGSNTVKMHILKARNGLAGKCIDFSVNHNFNRWFEIVHEY